MRDKFRREIIAKINPSFEKKPGQWMQCPPVFLTEEIDRIMKDIEANHPNLTLEEIDMNEVHIKVHLCKTGINRTQPLVIVLPGQKGFDILRRFTSKKNRDQILMPTRADDCDEYQAAFIRNDRWARRYWTVMMQVRPFAVLFYAKVKAICSFTGEGIKASGKSGNDSNDDDLTH
jgi:hypothetical protein